MWVTIYMYYVESCIINVQKIAIGIYMDDHKLRRSTGSY